MTIGQALQRAVKQSEHLTDSLGAKADEMSADEISALVQLGILYELRAIRLVLQSKE